MRDDPTVIALVVRATEGEQTAWDEIVERFAPLVWSICRRFRLSEADTYDVGQNVWLRLVEYLPSLREPAALIQFGQGRLEVQCRHDQVRSMLLYAVCALRSG